MEEIVKITKQVINGAGEVNAVDARDLHTFLESGYNFGNWITSRIKQYGFVEGIDFISYKRSIRTETANINTKEYTISLDMAMVLSITERCPAGVEAYTYFCEVQGRSMVVKHFKREEYYFGEEIVKKLFSQYTIIPQYPVLGKYRIDWYIPELKLAIEFDEPFHFSNAMQDKKRQSEIEGELGCKFARYMA